MQDQVLRSGIQLRDRLILESEEIARYLKVIPRIDKINIYNRNLQSELFSPDIILFVAISNLIWPNARKNFLDFSTYEEMERVGEKPDERSISIFPESEQFWYLGSHKITFLREVQSLSMSLWERMGFLICLNRKAVPIVMERLSISTLHPTMDTDSLALVLKSFRSIRDERKAFQPALLDNNPIFTNINLHSETSFGKAVHLAESIIVRLIANYPV